MRIIERFKKVASSYKKVSSAAEEYFAPQLEDLGLEKEQIERKTLKELEQSLIVVEKALKNPKLYGYVNFEIGPDGEPISTPDGHIRFSIEPFLLNRKRPIVERIKFLKGDESIETLRESAGKITDDNIRKELIEKVENLKKETRRWEEKSREVDEASTKEQSRTEEELAKLEKEAAIFERRSKIWRSFMERESVATTIGGVLMLIMSFALLSAMFFDIKTTEIVKSGYLVILGYFFGQASSRKKSE